MAVRVEDNQALSGALIGGRYALGEPLTTGGAAVVYRGWDTLRELGVALKSPRRDDSKSAAHTPEATAMLVGAIPLTELRWRLAREGQIMASLSHPHIARIYNYIEVEGWPWLALELVEGVDLWRAASERGPFSPHAALDVGRQVCAALGAIHAIGIIHRDVKPRNIILSPGGHATLIDFDLAWSPVLGDTGEPDMIYGTPEYMSPEQAMGERITAATDIYALGVTLYELLAGRAPFHASSASATMWRHVTETPPPLREWRHDLPAPVERAVMRALAKEPRRRYPSAEAMALALAQAQEEARMTHAQFGWRALTLLGSRPPASLAPAPIAETPEPATPASQADAKPGLWLMLTFWILALASLTLTLIILLALAQVMPE